MNEPDARAELSHLLPVVEAVQALADEWAAERYPDTGDAGWNQGYDLRRESDAAELWSLLESAWPSAEAARASLPVVEAVQALADEWADYEWTGPCAVEVQRVQAHTWEAATKEHARVLRAVLTSGSSSGEAESGEAVEIHHCDGCGEDYNAFEESHAGHVVAPVLSGGHAYVERGESL